MASVTIDGMGEFFRTFDDLQRMTNLPKILTRLGLFTMERVKTRTVEKGVGPDGPWPGRLAHYSPSYARLRRQQEQPTDHVYLFWTGGMMAAMNAEVHPGNELRVYFRPTQANPIRLQAPKRRSKTAAGKRERRETRTVFHRITEAEKAWHLHQRRPFFLLGEKDMDKLADLTGKYIEEEILKHGGR